LLVLGIRVCREDGRGNASASEDPAGSATCEVVECAGEKNVEVELEGELDDEDGVGEELAGAIVTFAVCQIALAAIPFGE